MADQSKFLYTKTHEWLEVVEPGACLVGLTDYAQDALGDIVYVRLPETGEPVTAGEPFTDIESVKAVSDVNSPVTGHVLDVNGDLDAEPDFVNSEPYRAWIAKLGFDELDSGAFMNADEYDEFVKGL